MRCRNALALVGALVLAACSEAPIKNAIYAHDQCHRLELVDERGFSVLGAEDMVQLPGGDLLVSAYDRRSKTADGTPPEGGIYRVPWQALSEKKLTVSSLIDTVPGGLRPHGIDAVSLSNKIDVAFVNRGSDETIIVEFQLENGETSEPQIYRDEKLCRANDLFLFSTRQQKEFLVSIDGKNCGGFASYWEMITNQPTGRLETRGTLEEPGLREKVDGVFDEFSFPNGVGIQSWWQAIGHHGSNFFAVAETRANQIRYLASQREPVKLPGSPDNITVRPTGIIYAALHPSLMKLALYRYKWPFFTHAPSRIVKVTGSQMLVLFDDPTGEVFSAASVAVHTGGKLVLGSVGDKGLLVCSPRDEWGGTS
ncbi:MAG: hypothetical protein AAFW47_01675 [Pseudomonadota bacterium]